MELHQFRQWHARSAGIVVNDEDFQGSLPLDGLLPYGSEVAALMGEFVFLHQQRLGRLLCQPHPPQLVGWENDLEPVSPEWLWMDYL